MVLDVIKNVVVPTASVITICGHPMVNVSPVTQALMSSAPSVTSLVPVKTAFVMPGLQAPENAYLVSPDFTVLIAITPVSVNMVIVPPELPERATVPPVTVPMSGALPAIKPVPAKTEPATTGLPEMDTVSLVTTPKCGGLIVIGCVPVLTGSVTLGLLEQDHVCRVRQSTMELIVQQDVCLVIVVMMDLMETEFVVIALYCSMD